MHLTQKETSYLQDAATQEQLCISLYQRHSQQAADPQLSQLLQNIANQEQHHLQLIQQLQQGQTPAGLGMQSGGGQQSGGQGSNNMQPSGQQAGRQSSNMQSGSQMRQPAGNQGGQQSPDLQSCHELLSLEKGVSDLYDHAVFEFTNQQARAALEHIQQEEHNHGYMLWQYMNQQGGYQVK